MASCVLHTRKLGRVLVTSSRWLQARFQSQELVSAYVFHPNVLTTEADKQMFLWTKTVQMNRPPADFITFMEEVDMEPMKNIMQTTILVSRVYEKREVKRKSKRQPKDLTHGTHENFPISLLQNQFKNVMGFARTYPQLRDLNPSPETAVSATWDVQGEVLSVHGRPGTFINSKKPMAAFYSPEAVQKSATTSMVSLGPIPVFIDLAKHLVKGKACTGLFPEKSLFPHFHTLLISDNGNYIPPPSQPWPEIQLLQKGLLFTFSRLLAQAVSKHGEGIKGNVLPEPECAQCIVTDGNRFSFIWYQLNTLDMRESESGVKNMVCIERPGETFAKVVEVAQHRHSLVDYNQDILKMYLSMLLMS